ncbi:MAG TPA: hypothetical protein VI793_02295 [Anaerolineales bacterium]|nr:hypothetical protein [Anaerolineales bacterium]
MSRRHAGSLPHTDTGAPPILDNPDLDGILIRPQPYTSASTPYVVDIKFHALQGADPVRIEACAIDVKDDRVCDTAVGDFDYRLYLPLTAK